MEEEEINTRDTYFLGEEVGLLAYVSNVKNRGMEIQTGRHDSPLTSTVIFLERSPRATAVVTSAIARTWPNAE